MIDIKNIIKEISLLDKDDKKNILNTLISGCNKDSYTKNLNGYFFNLLDVDLDTLEQINNNIKIIKESKKNININIIVNNTNTIIENIDNENKENELYELDNESDNELYNITNKRLDFEKDNKELYEKNINSYKKNKCKKNSVLYNIIQMSKKKTGNNMRFKNTTYYYMEEDYDNEFLDVIYSENEIDIKDDNEYIGEETEYIEEIQDNDELEEIEDNEEENDYKSEDIELETNDMDTHNETINIDNEIKMYGIILNNNGIKINMNYRLIKEEYEI